MPPKERIEALAGPVRDLSAPVNREWLSGRVGVLLGHYWTPDTPEQMTQAIARDWIGALCHLPQWALDVACKDWIANGTRKPVPGDIRERAMKRMEPVHDAARELSEAREQMRFGPPTKKDAAMKARVNKLVADFKSGRRRNPSAA